VYIGDNVLIENSFIGSYTSIGDKCNIFDTEISNSLIFDDSTIRECKLTDSIIGYKCNIGKNKTKPEASRVIVGDNSFVSI